MKKYIDLFLAMLKTGLFTFGGGYAMIALLENEFVSKREWVGREEFLDIVAIAESTPGPIAINAATYIGYKMLGFLGSLLATVAVCIPSFFVIYTISLFFDAFISFSLIACAFRGIQVCVIWLILSAGFRMLKQMKKTAFNIIILCGVTVFIVIFSLFSVGFSTVFYILICGALGLFLYFLSVIRAKKEASK